MLKYTCVRAIFTCIIAGLLLIKMEIEKAAMRVVQNVWKIDIFLQKISQFRVYNARKFFSAVIDSWYIVYIFCIFPRVWPISKKKKKTQWD